MLKKTRRLLPDILCVALFAVIALVYFYPADIEGRRLNQHDNNAADGIGVEINQYRDRHNGETPRWTNSVFGGMPTYQISPSYDSTRGMSFIEKAYHLWLPDYVFYIFISMLGFYILLRAFDFRQWMAALGAIVWAFSSYFFIIIAAGHIWKVLTLAYIPPTIGGMVLCYRKRYLWGCAVTTLFATLQILSNHVQMSYYFLVPELLIVISFLVNYISRNDVKSWLKGTAAIAVAAVLAIGINISNLYHTYEYSKDTMRGKSELVKQGKTEDQTDSGLERSYITAWSYGIDETWTLLVPNVKGGASFPLSANETAMKKADPTLANAHIYDAFTQYWGEQPGTSGPVYVGALVCMLFVLSLFILSWKSPLKWALLISTVVSILLAWGKNFMPFTDFCIDYIPMYSKFRTVASALVVAEFTIPLLAMLGLKEFVERCQEKENRGKMLRALALSTIITIGCCLFFAWCPTAFGDCVSTSDRDAVAQYINQGYFDSSIGANILASISSMREAMLTSDAWRSVFIIVLGAFIMWLIYKKKKYSTMLALALIAICLIDMWQVNKRYLNDSMFTPDTRITTNNYQPQDWEKYIIGKSGDGRNYRVLNLAVSTFNDNSTSFCFSSVGGYHAAKLRRYQELIEECVAPEMQNIYKVLSSAPLDTVAMRTAANPGYPVYDLSHANTDSVFRTLNMLNTRWFVMGGQEGINIPIENTGAYGNAWFVNDVRIVNTANEEIDALHNVNTHTTAVINRNLSTLQHPSGIQADSTANIKQISLTPDEVSYEADSKKGGLVVFSEIFYPGWTATIDGKEAPILRANYVLRAMEIPAGKHTIIMTFDPQTVKTTETIANICFYLFAAICVCLLWHWFGWGGRKEGKED